MCLFRRCSKYERNYELVGSLDALFFAKKGFKVDVYESRLDPRTEKYVSGRSINLALSCRGREALKAVGAEEHVVSQAIPMYARMIHSHSGKRTPIPYGRKDQYILSVDRRKLNEHLITVSDENPNITYHFKHKMARADLDKGSVYFESPDGSLFEDSGDLIVGCDGAFSALRRQMMRRMRMDYNQVYIPHGYKEIEMLPTEDGEFAMEVNYLHIWPRNTFMMIALPNQDKTFTLTLFMPYDKFDSIHTEEDIMAFFEAEFPDAIPLIGREKLISDYMSNPVGDMISIKCHPYHYKDKWVIKGDAAHALVPFYGQGMNCGFEDCLVFSEILEKNNMDFGKALPEYSRTRNPDAEAIVDLAMYNYIEMRAGVNSSLFLLRKHLDNFLHRILPRKWVPLYTMVSFTRIPYHTVIERRKKQDKILSYCLWFSFILGGVGIGGTVWKHTDGQLKLPTLSFLKFK